MTVLYGHFIEARYISTFRDTLSDSAPGEYSNHTIEFTVNTDIPASGYVRITPEDGMFDIPLGTFGINQAELYVAPPAQAYSLRSATTTPDATYDGISITNGTSGSVLFTLNSTLGIVSGSTIKIYLGTQTTNSTSTDTGILYPSATGTQPVYIEVGGGESGIARALVAIIENIGFGPGDTTEDVPPVRFNGTPTSTLSGLVTAAEISMETNEFARCRYSRVPDTPYVLMHTEFSNSGSLYHTFVATGLIAETTYIFYVRCRDDEGNTNFDDYEIEFTLKPIPEGEPGGGEDEGTGGAGEGSGTGSSGSGSGSSGGNSGSTQSGSGGSRGGGGGGGGTNSEDLPYESGDAIVIINGYAFPGSVITVLVDGAIADTGSRAANNGSFSVTLPAIARGVYTFGVYATDNNRVKSSTFSTTFSVAGARTSTLSNIHLMPTISVSPNPVDVGATVTFSGYAIPNSTVTLETQQEKTTASLKTLTTTSDGSGRWSAPLSTVGFSRDTWKVRAKSTQTATVISTNFSQYTFYGVGGAVVALTGNNSDLNRDGKVNLIDFSILLFHWNTDGGSSNPPADINRDGKVSLTDFSIMIFNWTG